MALRGSGWILLAIAVMAVSSVSCQTVRREVVDVDELLTRDPTGQEISRYLRGSLNDKRYVKAHMQDGSVYALNEAALDVPRGLLRGHGSWHDPYRRNSLDGAFDVPLDSIVILESNTDHVSGSVAALTIVTGLSLGMTGYCISNPKACFGSCPTFYGPTEEGRRLLAEGFSSSIAPSLEATDLDDLHGLLDRDGRVLIEMTNEAFETHVVRRVRMFAVTAPTDTDVFADANGAFHSVRGLRAPIDCTDERGSCLEQLASRDRTEWYSAADSTDLGATEFIDLDFVKTGSMGRYGVVISARQSLMSTYLLYQALAWMGTDVGTWFARIENRDAAVVGPGLQTLFGAIEVQVATRDGAWISVGTLTEVGPLATDSHVLPLPEGIEPSRIRLRVRRGGWRIDHVAVADLSGPPEVVALEPTQTYRRGRPDPEALALLSDPELPLVTFPGDRIDIEFSPPVAEKSTRYFLESTGYYLEWMRSEWMEETNPAQLARLMFDPDGVLKILAPAYKAQEAGMDSVFWNSRYAF